ncbi:MAG: beta-ketoacyl synthase N-terminal-like domain-containing protein, partial [Methanobacteriota archaeon]
GASIVRVAERLEQSGREAAAPSVVVTGASVGLPGRSHRLFDDANVERLLRGDTGIDRLSEKDEDAILGKRIVRLVKDHGEPRMEAVKDRRDVIHLAGKKGAFDLAAEYGLDEKTVDAWDVTTRLAIAAGLEALRDARIPLVREQRATTNGRTLPGGWVLPESMRDDTGIVFASAFPGLDSLLSAVEKERRGESFDRKILFRVLSFGHAQLAELLRARGPATQVNAACASTTQAIAIAEDWIRTGRCRRVLVVGADDATSEHLLPWVGAGFLASGAATTAETVEEGALPFDRRRHGMIIGMGAVGLVLEAAGAAEERGVRPAARLVATVVANSAFHGSRLDVDHIAGVVERFVAGIARTSGIPCEALARETVFVSHETYTPARGGSASAEVQALRRAFGPSGAPQVLVANTKGYTGHPMGAGIEDVLAVKTLEHGVLPAVPNLRDVDPEFADLSFARGGPHDRRFVLRLAAGFGSQLALAFFEKGAPLGARIDAARHQSWLDGIAGRAGATVEVAKRTLRLSEAVTPIGVAVARPFGPAAVVPAGTAVTPRDAKSPPAKPATAAAERPPSLAMQATAARAEPAPPPQAQPATGIEMKERLLTLVSEKTGYPKDVLALDLDLEADLGIDTVKQAEILGSLRETYSFPREDGIRIKDYPTLNHVLQYLSTRLGRAVAAEPPSAAAASKAVARTVMIFTLSALCTVAMALPA